MAGMLSLNIGYLSGVLELKRPEQSSESKDSRFSGKIGGACLKERGQDAGG